MRDILRVAAKSTAHVFGLDLVRFPSLAERTMLGLSGLGIQTVLDVGANLGQFARRALRTFPGAQIYCFEPHAVVFAELERWAARSGEGRIACFETALGDTDGELELRAHSVHPSSSSLLATTETSHRIFPQTVRQSPMRIHVSRLDGFVDAHSLALADELLIKLDVQGFEDRVIRGGERTFARARACLLEISFLPLYAEQATFHELYLALHRLGFRYAGNLSQIPTADGRVIYVDAIFLRE